MVNGLVPRHLSCRLPSLVSDRNPYHMRNPLERDVPFYRNEMARHSFIPSAATEWNNLDDTIKQANSVTQFKRMLAQNDVKVPKLYYSENRSTEIIHCKIRLQISDLNNHLFQRYLRTDSKCDCGFKNENSKHYFFDCPMHTEARMQTIQTIPNFTNLRLESLTHGDNSLTLKENRFIFDKVQQFITLSNRFN